jgi:hypothetical protein
VPFPEFQQAITRQGVEKTHPGVGIDAEQLWPLDPQPSEGVLHGVLTIREIAVVPSRQLAGDPSHPGDVEPPERGFDVRGGRCVLSRLRQETTDRVELRAVNRGKCLRE